VSIEVEEAKIKRRNDILSQHDAVKLALASAERSREVSKEVLDVLYEKCVLDEISVDQLLYMLENGIQAPAYKGVIQEVRRRLGEFT
jgi:hypothetical protein